jgi:hypothetical protein
MKILVIILLFFTAWVVIISGVVYLLHRLGSPLRQRGTCCLEVPCSTRCAQEHQAARDRLAVEYDKVVREIGAIVTAGAELETAGPMAAGGRETRYPS